MTLTNKNVEFGSGENKLKTTYFKLICDALSSVPVEGKSIGEQRKSFKLLDKIEGAKKGGVDLEKDELIYISNAVEKTKWFITGRGLVQLGDDLQELIGKKE